MTETIEAKILSAAYAADESAANTKYANQKLRISGEVTVEGVCRNFEGGTLIEIRECTVIP